MNLFKKALSTLLAVTMAVACLGVVNVSTVLADILTWTPTVTDASWIDVTTGEGVSATFSSNRNGSFTDKIFKDANGVDTGAAKGQTGYKFDASKYFTITTTTDKCSVKLYMIIDNSSSTDTAVKDSNGKQIASLSLSTRDVGDVKAIDVELPSADTYTFTSGRAGTMLFKAILTTGDDVKKDGTTTTTTTVSTTTTTETTTEATTTTVSETTTETTSSVTPADSEYVSMKVYNLNSSTVTSKGEFSYEGLNFKSLSDLQSDHIRITSSGTITFKAAVPCTLTVTLTSSDLYIKGGSYTTTGQLIDKDNASTQTLTLEADTEYTLTGATTSNTRVSKLVFTALDTTPAINGKVTLDGTAKSGVTVTLSKNGTKIATATTDSNGGYSFRSDSTEYTLENGTYTVSVAKTNAYGTGSTTVNYASAIVAAETINLVTTKYKVHFRTDIKDYKNDFIVKDEEGKSVYTFDSDDYAESNTSSKYRESTLNKYTDLPAGTYTIEYEGTNYEPVANGTSIPKGTKCSFIVPSASITLVDIKLQPVELTDTITYTKLNGVLPVGTTLLSNLGEEETKTGVYFTQKASSSNDSYGKVAVTSSASEGGYIVFKLDDTYSVSISTRNQAGALYAYADGATINGKTTPVALDSNFGTYTLTLTAGTYVIKGATEKNTEVTQITVYQYSAYEVMAGNLNTTDKGNLILTTQLKESAVNAGTKPEDFNAGELAVIFAQATSDNLTTLKNPQALKDYIGTGETDFFYVTIQDAMYEKIYNGDEMICGDEDESTMEYYHGFELENATTNFYAVAAIYAGGKWNPDTEGIMLVDVTNGTATNVSSTASTTE
jgi:hypothetical protein